METIFSIIMPTLNSEQTLEKSLNSIINQEFDQKNIEILLCDGGSSDRTVEIGLNFGCKIINNPNKLPEWGKYYGLVESKGKYIIFMDSDEEFINRKSLLIRLKCFESNKEVKNIICSGLLNPPDYSKINSYVNSIGDPFSFFMYGIEGDNFQNSLLKKYRVTKEENDFYIISFKKGDLLPIIDGGTHTFEKKFLEKLINNNISISTIPLIFNLMARKTSVLGVIKNDYINHFSSSNFKIYISKIKWRVENNIFSPSKTGVGFANRENLLPLKAKIKKYLFIFYSLSIIFPFLTGTKLSLKKRNLIFLIHPLISFFTIYYIIYCIILKILGKNINPKIYGKKIKKNF